MKKQSFLTGAVILMIANAISKILGAVTTALFDPNYTYPMLHPKHSDFVFAALWHGRY